MYFRHFKKVLDANILRGKPHEVIASACIYIACRQERVARSFKDITAVCSASHLQISRCFKKINNFLQPNVGIVDIGEYLGRYCCHLDLSKPTQKAARTIVERAMELDLVPGRSPVSVAAAAIYMACHASNDIRSHSEIGSACGVSESTIKQVYILLRRRSDELLPELATELPAR